MIAFIPPGSELNPPALQVDPPPGDKLFDARNRDAWIRDAMFPNNESRIEEIAVPNAIQTAAYEFSAKGGGRRVAGFDAWAMGADETRVHLVRRCRRSSKAVAVPPARAPGRRPSAPRPTRLLPSNGPGTPASGPP